MVETGTRFETSDNMPKYMKSVQLFKVLEKSEELELGKKIEIGAIASTELDGAEEGSLDSDDIKILNAKIREGREAIEMLVTANLRYVVQQANKFIGQGVSIDDLIQEGNEALQKAAKKFDHRQNKKFITFAHFYLQKAFNLANGNFGKIVRLPQNQEYDIYKRKMAGEEVHTSTIQLDRPIGENGDNTLGDIILKVDPNTETERDHDKFVITALMNRLDKVSAQIVTKRFGLDGNDELTLKEVAEELRIPQGEVNKLYKTAMSLMRK